MFSKSLNFFNENFLNKIDSKKIIFSYICIDS